MSPFDPTDALTSPTAHVLVIEDDAILRHLIRASLEAQGHSVAEAGTGEEGIARFLSLKPDLIVLDVNMPGMGGLEACRLLRALPKGESTPVLVLTGSTDPEDIEKAYDAGATDFLAKPVAVRLLQDRVRFLLRAVGAFERLRRSERNLAMAQRVARLGNWVVAGDGGGIEVSVEARRIMGLNATERVRSLPVLRRHVVPDDRERVEHAAAAAGLSMEAYELRYRVMAPGGSVRWVRENGEFVREEGQGHPQLVGTLLDVTEQVEAEQRIHDLAYVDPVSGLANRARFTQTLTDTLDRSAAEGAQFGVLFIDLDRFKRINDTLGHSVGDELLQCVAQRLAGCLRRVSREGPACPGSLLARLGGDEFAVLLPGVGETEVALSVGRRLISALDEPFVLGEYELVMSASIGAAVYPVDGDDVDTLLRRADTAMYHVKDRGGNSVQAFGRKLGARAGHRLRLESNLRRALDRGEFELHYQPKVEVGDMSLVGSEALLRWRDPRRGLVSPADFIPLAEETGLIVPIGEWALREACRQQQAWRRRGLPVGRVAVNLSPKQFAHRHLVPMVGDVLGNSGLDASALELEVTETMVMRDVDSTVGTLGRLRDLGVHIAIDDFGTGHASLNYLRRFPIDTLKIDRSFINHVTRDPDDGVIASMIIALGRALHLNVVAEGVERDDQLEFLRREGCDVLQGYLFSRPLPVVDFESLLGSMVRLTA